MKTSIEAVSTTNVLRPSEIEYHNYTKYFYLKDIVLQFDFAKVYEF